MNPYKRASDEAYAEWARTHQRLVRLRREARERELPDDRARELACLEELETRQFRDASRLWRLYQQYEHAHQRPARGRKKNGFWRWIIEAAVPKSLLGNKVGARSSSSATGSSRGVSGSRAEPKRPLLKFFGSGTT